MGIVGFTEFKTALNFIITIAVLLLPNLPPRKENDREKKKEIQFLITMQITDGFPNFSIRYRTDFFSYTLSPLSLAKA